MISLLPLTLLAFVAILFWSPQNTQQQEAGEIREVKCKGYVQRPNAEPKELRRTDERKLKLYPLDQVKCVGPGTLELILHGQHVSIKEEYGWYPIPVPNNPPPDESGKSRVGRLRGTFRLEQGPNDLGEPFYNLPEDWIKPLNPPSILAIELGGSTVTMASSRFPKFSFVADGREYEVETSQGQIAKVMGVLDKNQLTIRSKTETNGTLEAVFTLQPDGKLKLSQSFSETGVPTISKEANYLKVADVAFLDIFPTESPDRPIPAEGFLLKKGERIVAEVDTDISSILAKEGDEFSLTVKEPARFQGAKVKGHLSDIKRSSEGDVLHLNFDVILLTNGTGYRFPGKMEVKGGNTPQTAGTATSKEGTAFGIVSSPERGASEKVGAAVAPSGVKAYVSSYIKIDKGTEIVMTPISGPP